MPYLTYQDLSERLRVPIGTLYAWVSQGRIPFIRLAGRLVRFDEAEIDQWILQGTASTSPTDGEA